MGWGWLGRSIKKVVKGAGKVLVREGKKEGKKKLLELLLRKGGRVWKI